MDTESPLKLLIDADALPVAIRELLIRAAEREKVECLLVAAKTLRVPESEYVRSVAAGSAFNGADDWIAERAAPGDLVVTADIPLADRAIQAGAAVLKPNGEAFTVANIKNALAMRELMEELRITGEVSGGPPPFSPKDRERFANAISRFLSKKKR